jgi:hypothetical protein
VCRFAAQLLTPYRFPNDESLRETYSQFMLGPSILVTPVLVPNVETVQGVFPGIGNGERWYDWYTLSEVDAQPERHAAGTPRAYHRARAGRCGSRAAGAEADHC